MLDLSCGMEGDGGGKGKRGGEINRSLTTGLSSTGLISSHAHCTVPIQTPMGVSTSPISEGDRSGTFDGSPDRLIDQPYQDFPTPPSRPLPHDNYDVTDRINRNPLPNCNRVPRTN